MEASSLINFFYIVSAILFILGIKMLGSADTARRGNGLSSIGMLIAVIVTLIDKQVFDSWVWIAGGIGAGAVIGFVAAKKVQMTSMPELVALFNGFGGLASLFVGWAEYQKIKDANGGLVGNLLNPSLDHFTASVVFLAVFIGGITFTGSIYAWGKLSGKIGGQAKVFSGQKAFNMMLMLGVLVCGVLYAAAPNGENAYGLFLAIVGLSLLVGIFGVMPIGGGDMPVVISLLNSCSGLAACAAGFVIQNNVLIVAGCLVGASGLILTIIMCKAMNRTLANVLFSGFGASAQKTGGKQEGEMKAISGEDAYYVLEAASSVVFVPGYGMAVAQAQHAVKELGEILEENGAEVRYAIHPVAGRMPGHMNVLLAEADVPYEQLSEMDDVNPIMSTVDVAIVIGANDVVNPAAGEDPSSPIYGMPIINVFEAKTVFALKRGQGAGFSGLVNQLFFRENTRMLYGDAKATVTDLVGQFKD
ncbi:NAD(P)(+) transhydrogenase (Re/Si-specific) subunit beta [Opitutia bacterium ISCC 51]|nr:NAD(P)(+) transhydrogenase (Re/Si-specific) subunit beta [Opitutae bacterium ISCC 51]QXD27803.1 NAD(P)(+) transhydrogenase (Re/Si-specific) subunit beta [Opitutae bacterium ISCC 52]